MTAIIIYNKLLILIIFNLLKLGSCTHLETMGQSLSIPAEFSTVAETVTYFYLYSLCLSLFAVIK